MSLLLAASDTITGVIFILAFIAAIVVGIVFLVKKAKKKKEKKSFDQKTSIKTETATVISSDKESNELCDQGAYALKEEDTEKAYACYEAAYKKGNARGALLAGMIACKNSPAFSAKYRKGLSLLEEADRMGHPFACSWLTMFLFSASEEDDKQKLVKYYKQMLTKEDEAACIVRIIWGSAPDSDDEDIKNADLFAEKLSKYHKAYPDTEPTTPSEIEASYQGIPEMVTNALYRSSLIDSDETSEEALTKRFNYLEAALARKSEDRVDLLIFYADALVHGKGTKKNLKKAGEVLDEIKRLGGAEDDEFLPYVIADYNKMMEMASRISGYANDDSQSEKDYWGALAEGAANWDTSSDSSSEVESEENSSGPKSIEIDHVDEYLGNKYIVAKGCPSSQYKVYSEKDDKVLIDTGKGLEWYKVEKKK